MTRSCHVLISQSQISSHRMKEHIHDDTDTDVCQICRVVSGVLLNSEVILLVDKIDFKHKMTRRQDSLQFPV